MLSPRDIIYQIEKVLSPKNITSIRAKHCHEIQDLEEIFKDFESQLEKKMALEKPNPLWVFSFLIS